MSKTMLNRLALLEVLDGAGPLTITELARRSGSDVTVVSRTVSACEPDGWIARQGNRVMIGPRCALLGHTSAYTDVIATATRLTHALAGVTGLTANAVGLVGSDAVIIAAAAGVVRLDTSGLAAKAPLHSVAAGIAIASELEPDRLTRLLGPEPYPDAEAVIARMLGTSAEVLFADREDRPDLPASDDSAAASARVSAAAGSAADGSAAASARVSAAETAADGSAAASAAGSAHGAGRQMLPRTRAELDARLADARDTGWVLDTGGLDPRVHCIAVPWPQRVMPAALSLLGPPDAVSEGRERAIGALWAAAAPGGTAQAVLASEPVTGLNRR